MIYEDDGETKDAFNRQQYEIISLGAKQNKDELDIWFDSDGFEYEGKPQHRDIELQIHHLTTKPKKVEANGQIIKVSGKSDAEAYFDKQAQLLKVTLNRVSERIQIKIKLLHYEVSFIVLINIGFYGNTICLPVRVR